MLTIQEYHSNTGKLLFQGKEYHFEENLTGYSSIVFILTRQDEKTVLKLSCSEYSEPIIFPQLTNFDRIPKLLNFGEVNVTWNGYSSSFHNRKRLRNLDTINLNYVHLTYLPGVPLNHLRSDQAQYKSLLIKLIDYVYQLNRQGICHGDIKEDNTIIFNNQVYLIDWSGAWVDTEPNESESIIELIALYLYHTDKLKCDQLNQDLLIDGYDSVSLYLARKMLIEIVDKYI